jgi:DNA-binding CsgD family transcriptional regulator
VEEDELLALVKELIAAQLVVEETGERFAFRHALTREAIYADLLVRERVALHRAVASALERTHVGVLEGVIEALAYHASEAGDWARAADYAARAARHAMALSAPREAVAQLDRAFQASEKAGITVSVELLLARGWANETLAEFDRAREDFTSALERARVAGDQRSAWEALHALGMLWAARDYSRAGDYRRDALTVARAIGDDVLVARSLNRVGNWHVNLDEPRAGLPHHEEALALFERLGDQRGVTETVDLLAVAHQIAGDQRAAAAYFERSIPLFTAADDRRGLANALGLLVLCGPSHHVAGTTPFATPRAQNEITTPQSLRLAREIGWRAGESFMCFLIGDGRSWRGEYDRALPMAREALDLAEQIGHLQWTAAARRLLGSTLLDLCAPELAREQLEAAHEIARTLGSRVWIRWTAGPLALARMRTGDVAGAEELLEAASCAADGTAGASVDSTTLTLGERQLWLARAELAVETQRPERALEIADARLAVERAANPNSVLGVPRLTLVRAHSLLALDRLDEATAALDTAREEATQQGARPLLWRIEAADGQVHRARRERLEARQAFDRASAIADEVALKIDDEELRAEFLNGVASLIPSAPAPSAAQIAKAEADGLTRRERDVARLVALGKANKAIANDLGIGERTVEGYVASALAKLGFDSRARLAAWAVTKGLAEPAHPVQTPRAD